MKKFSKLAIWLIVAAAAWVLLGPLLFRLLGGYPMDKTGQLGDMFGGMSAPVIGLLSAVLVYFAFQAQIEANDKITEQIKVAHQETNFTYFLSELDIIIGKFENVQFIQPGDNKVVNGSSAIFSFSNGFNKFVKENLLEESKRPESYQDLSDKIEIGLHRFRKFFYELELFLILAKNINLSEEHRPIANTKMSFFYSRELKHSLERIASTKVTSKNLSTDNEAFLFYGDFMRRVNRIIEMFRDLKPLLPNADEIHSIKWRLDFND